MALTSVPPHTRICPCRTRDRALRFPWTVAIEPADWTPQRLRSSRDKGNELDVFQAALLERLETLHSACLVFLASLADAKRLTVAVLACDHKPWGIAHFATPAPLHHDPVKMEIRGNPCTPPSLDLRIDHPDEGVENRSRQSPTMPRDCQPPGAPARYISIKTSSTPFSQ